MIVLRSFSALARQIAADEDARRARLRSAMSDAAQAGVEILRSVTPVDTGRARAGWSYRRVGVFMVLENDVPYVEFLERGTVHMAPRLFVATALPRIARTMAAVTARALGTTRAAAAAPVAIHGAP